MQSNIVHLKENDPDKWKIYSKLLELASNKWEICESINKYRVMCGKEPI